MGVPPIGANLAAWAGDMRRWLERSWDSLTYKSAGASASEDGVLLWDPAGPYPVVSVAGAWVPLSSGGGGANLTYTAATRVVASDTGTDATLTLADGVNAGLMTSADFTKLAGVAAGANNYVHPNHSGDVTSVADGATTIVAGAVTLAKQANVATGTVFYRKTALAGAPEVQTLATLKTDLGLTGTNTGDQASIVGITGTKAQFNTAVSDGDIQFVGDAPTVHAHLLAAGATDVTVTAANLNTLDDGVNTTLHFHDADRARANHTGTQLAATISDFSTAADARIAAASINALSDVIITAPSATQVLKYNGTNWINDTDATGGGGGPTRIAGSSGAAGADFTLQKLTANAAANSTTTLATVMTTTGVGVGVWRFQYNVIYQAAATTTGVDFAINHTGAASAMVVSSLFTSTGGAAATGLAKQVGTNTANMAEGKSARELNTKIGSTLGVDVANANMLMLIEGTIVVTTTGSLELKHASEVAAASTVMAGTNLILTFIG